MTTEKFASYIGSAVAILGGFGIMYFPPAVLGPGSGTAAFATALVVGGLAALGVTVTVPVVRAQARREGLASARTTKAP